MKATFLYTLRRHRFSLLGWGIGLFVLALSVAQVYPIVQEQGETIQELMQGLPKQLIAFTKLDPSQGITAKTVLDGRFFLLMPIILGIFAALAGSGLLVSDEEAGRLDLYLAYPVSRRAFFFSRLAALTLVLIGILALGWAGMTVGIYWVSIKIDPLLLVFPFMSLFAVVFLTANLGLLFSMVLPARRVAGMAAGLIVVASFFINGFAQLSDAFEWYARLLPLRYYQGTEAMDQFNPFYFCGLLLASAACVGLAYWRFELRDIRVAGEGVFPWKKFAVGAGVVAILIAVPVIIAMQPKTYNSPQEVFDAAMVAMEDEDWATVSQCLTDEGIDDWNTVLVAFGSLFETHGKDLSQLQSLKKVESMPMDRILTMFSMFGKYKSAMRQVETEKLKDHQAQIFAIILAVQLGNGAIPVNDQQRKLAELVKKPKKFFTKAMKAWSIAHEFTNPPVLENVKVRDGKAQAEIAWREGSRTDVVFVKSNGSWRIFMPFLPGKKRNVIQP